MIGLYLLVLLEVGLKSTLDSIMVHIEKGKDPMSYLTPLSSDDSKKVHILSKGGSAALTVQEEALENLEDPFVGSVDSLNLTPHELESSKQVRRKYGIGDELHTEYIHEFRGEQDLHSQVILNTLQKIVNAFLERLVDGCVIENENKFLEPLLVTIEIALWHGWNRKGLFGGKTIWDLIVTVSKKHGVSWWTAIENVQHFSTLRNPTTRIRAWIRIALMNKSLSPCLNFLISHQGCQIR